MVGCIQRDDYFFQIHSDGLYRKLCGLVTRTIYITEKNWAVIFFTSDYTVNGLGFLIKFSKIAGKLLDYEWEKSQVSFFKIIDL